MNDHRSLAAGLPFLVALTLVGGAVSSRAQSVLVSLRSSQPSPVSGAVVLTAEVPPDPGLLAVRFKLDGHVLDAPDTTPPYEVVWSAASAASGQHMVTAAAHYGSGAIVESAPLRLTVVNPPTFNRILYVDATSGNDGKDGASPATAWRTLGKANSSVVAGDTVLLRGIFTAQDIRPAVSGTPAKPITFKSFTGQSAVLAGGVSGTALSLNGRSYIVVERLRIQNASGRAVDIDNGAHHNVVRDCVIVDTATAPGTWGNAVRISRSSNDNLIERNEVTNTGNEGTNSGDSFWIDNGSSRNRLLNNTLRNGGHSLIWIGGDKPRDLAVADNVVAGNTLSNPWTTPLGLSWMARRTLVERNRIADAGNGGGGIPRSGIQLQARDSIIRYNVVVNNAGPGIRVLAYTFTGGVEPIPQDAIGNQIYHNVFYGNGTYGLWISERDGRSVSDNLIANNIFFRNAGDAIGIEHYHNPTAWPVAGLNGNRIVNNIFLRQPGAAGEPMVRRIRNTSQGGALTYTLAAFQQTYRDAADNLDVDPLFTDEVGRVFTLRPDSPAVGRGLHIPGVAHHGSAPDIGAFEVDRERRANGR